MKKLSFLILLLVIILGGFYFFGPLSNKNTEAPNQDAFVSEEENARNLVEAARTGLIGVWQSKEDPRFTREFKSNGAAEDRYDNGDSFDETILSWNVFSRAYPEVAFPYSYEENAVYLLLGNGRDDLFFKVIKVTPEELELVYMDRGGVLNFVRKP